MRRRPRAPRRPCSRLTQELSTADVLRRLRRRRSRRTAAASRSRPSRTDVPADAAVPDRRRPVAGRGLPELYLVDLDGQSLRRVTARSTAAPSPLGRSRAPVRRRRRVAVVRRDRAPAGVRLAGRRTSSPATATTPTTCSCVTDTAPPAGVPGRTAISPPPRRPADRARLDAGRCAPSRRRTGRCASTPTSRAPASLRATVRATVPVTRHVRVRKRGGGHRTVTRRVLAQRQVALKSARPRGARAVAPVAEGDQVLHVARQGDRRALRDRDGDVHRARPQGAQGHAGHALPHRAGQDHQEDQDHQEERPKR